MKFSNLDRESLLKSRAENKALTGFAKLTREQLNEICSRGGKKAHAIGRAHKFTSEEARLAGKKGGDSISQNRQHMSEIGRRGGAATSQNRQHMSEIGRKGGLVKKQTENGKPT